MLIGVLTLFMWALIFERLIYLYRGHRRAVGGAIAAWQARAERGSWHAYQVRRRLISVVSQHLETNLGLIKTCVVLAPLMGLLGTVTGMVEVFDVISISGSGNARSVASGVSKATVPTLGGMVSAISGFGMHVFLYRRAVRERELLRDHLIMEH